MAFVAALPTVIGGLGTLASAVPLIGGPVASLLGTGAAGTGLSGALGALGSGAGLSGITGALSGGLQGMLPAFGGMGGGGAAASGGLGQLYGGLDKLFGGFLPNLGVGGTITPSQGLLGMMMPNKVGNNPMFGGDAFNNTNLTLEEAAMRNAGTGGIGGGIGGIGEKLQDMKVLLDSMKKDPAPTPAATEYERNVRSQSAQSPAPQVISNAAAPKRTGIYGDLGSGGLIGQVMSGGGAYQETSPFNTQGGSPYYRSIGLSNLPLYQPSGADRALDRLLG